MNWISVKDELPSIILDRVLICCDYISYVSVGKYTGEWWWDYVKQTYVTYITHWMPLPDSA